MGTHSLFLVETCHKFACTCEASEYTFRDEVGGLRFFFVPTLALSPVSFRFLLFPFPAEQSRSFSERPFKRLRPKKTSRKRIAVVQRLVEVDQTAQIKNHRSTGGVQRLVKIYRCEHDR